jgi:hypothetical protein
MKYGILGVLMIFGMVLAVPAIPQEREELGAMRISLTRGDVQVTIRTRLNGRRQL